MVTFDPDPYKEYYEALGIRRDFHKKYPKRSNKNFKVLPTLDVKVDLKEKINLKVLQIGPRELYFSEQNKIFIKFQDAIVTLAQLTKTRQNIELQVLRTQSYETLDKENTSTGYQYQQQVSCIIRVARSESAMVIFVFKNLEPFCLNNVPEFKPQGAVLVNDMNEALEQVVRLQDFEIVKLNGFLNISLYSDEAETIKESLDDFILAVKSVSTELWALKNIVMHCGQEMP